MEGWRLLAKCFGMDPDIWFSDEKSDKRLAISICIECHVQEECLEYALTHRIPYGIWGAMTPSQRDRFRRKTKFKPKYEPKPILMPTRV